MRSLRRLLRGIRGPMKVKTDVQSRSLSSLAEEVRAYEIRFGVPSDRLPEAFMDGQLEETPELHRWSLLYLTLQAAQRAAGR